VHPDPEVSASRYVDTYVWWVGAWAHERESVRGGVRACSSACVRATMSVRVRVAGLTRAPREVEHAQRGAAGEGGQIREGDAAASLYVEGAASFLSMSIMMVNHDGQLRVRAFL
jgi:hypothetical protein